MNSGKHFTVVINCVSHDPTMFMMCLSSIYDAAEQPENIIAIFDGYTNAYNPVLDLEELRHIDLLKTTKLIGYNAMRNFVLQYLATDATYVMFLNDDTCVREYDLFRKVIEYHNQGYPEVRLSERQVAVSYDPLLFDEIGYFDEYFLGYGFEDVDHEFVMRTKKIPYISVDPYLIHHLRKEKLPNDKNVINFNLKTLLHKWQLDCPHGTPENLLYSDVWYSLKK